MLNELRTILLRDLEGLRREIALYPDDYAPWRMLPGLPNSGGSLALHLTGNLSHYVGAQLGGTGYVRNRDAEFGSGGLTRAELDAEVQRAIAVERAGVGAGFHLRASGATARLAVALAEAVSRPDFRADQLFMP